MSPAKAFGGLLLVYLVIVGGAIWQARRTCLVIRDDCGAAGLLELVLSERLMLVGSIIILLVLVFITWQFIALARANQLGVQQDDDERTLNVNGLLVSLLAFGLYLGVALVVLMSAANALEISDIDTVDSFFWTCFWVTQGALLVFAVLWHLNDSFVKPVSGFVLLLLGGITFGSLYWVMKSTILTM